MEKTFLVSIRKFNHKTRGTPSFSNPSHGLIIPLSTQITELSVSNQGYISPGKLSKPNHLVGPHPIRDSDSIDF